MNEPAKLIDQSLRRFADAARGSRSGWLSEAGRAVVERAIAQLIAHPPKSDARRKPAEAFSPFIYPH